MAAGWELTAHAMARGRERIAGVCPATFLRCVCAAIDARRHDLVEFVGWAEDNRAVWRARARTREAFIVVVDLPARRVITVFADRKLNQRRLRGASDQPPAEVAALSRVHRARRLRRQRGRC